jgi:PAS domain S-box-containing protein
VSILVVVLSTLLSVYGLIELVEGLGKPVLSLEEWLFPNTQLLGAILTGRMSPATAALLFFSGAVFPMLFLRERNREHQNLFRDMAGGLGVLVTMVGAVFVLSYLHGAPILYGTATIPMAATTAIAFLLLGTGQVLAVGPDGFPSRLFAGPSTRARLLRVFVSTTVGVVVAIDLMHVYAHRFFFNVNASISGFSTAAFLVMAGTLIARVALKVGDDMDRSEGVRKRAEEALRESEEKFRAIFEDSKDGIILVDEDSRKFHTCNKAFCDMVQYTVDEVRQLGVMDVHPEEDVPWIIEEFDRRARSETEKEIDIPVKRKDGSVFWAAVKSSPVTISGKKYVFGNFRDVTERRKAEETLARLGMAVGQAPEAIIMTDREGTILYVNPAFERISGYSGEEAVGKTPRILRSGKQDESFYREIWHTLKRGEVWTGHFINRKKDGSLYEEDATISPVRDSSGNIVSFVGVMRDVTQLLSLEKQVRTAQKMEAVGTLAGGIAHDFNNALTGIVGFGELLRMRLAGDGQALHDLDEILRCAERAATLTRHLLTFARRQVIEPVNMNLSALVADLMKLIGKVVGEHIEVKTSLNKNVPTIFADRGQIEQVVMNLCLNARDAMPEGGRLVVETEDVYLEEEYVRQNPYMKTGRYAMLTVSDMGVGMDEKTRERVFEPFFTTKGPDKGTGLGLAMVYGIVKQHGGFIHLYSEPGKGTAFKVYFPAVEAQTDAVPAKRGEEILRGGKETILLAEDEEAIRALAERVLTGFGYTVLVARNGEEAIEIFRQHKEIDLAVLDVVMPRKGGKEAFDEMHKANPNLKVIFMSGYSADAIHDSFVLTPGMPFLQKPFGPTVLARKVRETLDTQ